MFFPLFVWQKKQKTGRCLNTVNAEHTPLSKMDNEGGCLKPENKSRSFAMGDLRVTGMTVAQ
jgi:hypothetical protein